jgi:drug/metabolite transporter (DMT)-like permease
MKKSSVMHHLVGAFMATLGGICWGISGSIGQYLFTVQGMDSKWLVPIRLGCAGIILLLFSAFRYGKGIFDPWRNKAERLELVIYGLLGVSLCQFFYFLTIQLSTAGVATILQDLSPIFILLVTCVQLKRAPKPLEILSILFALLGVFLITTHGSLQSLSISASALLAGILCAICVTVYNIVPSHIMKKYSVVMLQGWAFLMGGIFFSIVFQPWSFHYVPNGLGYLGIAGVVLIGNCLAFPLYMIGVQMIGASEAILYGFSEPVSAAIIGVALLGTPLTGFDALGFVFIFVMLALVSVNS